MSREWAREWGNLLPYLIKMLLQYLMGCRSLWLTGERLQRSGRLQMQRARGLLGPGLWDTDVFMKCSTVASCSQDSVVPTLPLWFCCWTSLQGLVLSAEQGGHGTAAGFWWGRCRRAFPVNHRSKLKCLTDGQKRGLPPPSAPGDFGYKSLLKPFWRPWVYRKKAGASRSPSWPSMSGSCLLFPCWAPEG